ncbi:hypothetical protein PCC7424_3510 [Gloeothece citriformis PCC 7424]|uniref:PEP-CTERM sorting domain-containing protein n=1 Tax=Gloeothece citriformis (strain PCC 7424) TaxID=65393 RepID=B7KGH5_GLOC7|nr:hypothetical protein [Gloeothece citriformis]ACK71902.1 hypothetical protein PCC7424_3510 [Gloeothece citriformis PCC 7424]
MLNFNFSLKSFFKLTLLALVNSGVNCLPSYAATFTSLSHVYFEMRDFSLSPQGVGLINDGKVRIDASEGILEQSLDVDAAFSGEDIESFAYASIRNNLFGTGNDYYAKIEFSSSLFGAFPILAGQVLRFNFTGFLWLANQNNASHSSIFSLEEERISNSGSIQLFFQDNLNQNSVEGLNIFGRLNNYSLENLDLDTWEVDLGENITLTYQFEQISFADGNKYIQTIFTGTFEKYFTEDTQLTLVAVVDSCNYASQTVNNNNCAIVPEPPNHLAVIVLVLIGGSIKLFSRVKN